MEPEANYDVSASHLEDMRYFSELAERESDRIFGELQACLDESVSAAASSAMRQLCIVAGELAARVNILETALELQLADTDPFRGGPLLRGAHRVEVENLARALDGHPLEVSESGRKMIWTRRREMHFHLYANRSRRKFARLWFEAIIKPEYARTLEVRVDGTRQKHALLKREAQYAIEWELPESEDLAPTAIDIKLPDLHSPAEVGAGEDHRKLGIAVTGLEFDASRRQSRVSRLLRR